MSNTATVTSYSHHQIFASLPGCIFIAQLQAGGRRFSRLLEAGFGRDSSQLADGRLVTLDGHRRMRLTHFHLNRIHHDRIIYDGYEKKRTVVNQAGQQSE